MKLEIAPHRKKIVERDLEKEFKDEENPFRFAIVCAMWITGFDAPCVSTVYLDKPKISFSKVISKEWNYCENIFGNDKAIFNSHMTIINKYRVDSHAKNIDDNEMALFRISITKLENQLENYF